MGACAPSVCARCWRPARSAGSARHLGPGTLVVPDQLVDRTSGRTSNLLRRGRRPRLLRRPVLPDGTTYRPRARGPVGLVADRRRHPRRHLRPAVLDPRRVPVVRRQRLVDRRHDRHPGGGARPRTRALLHHVALVTDLDAGVETGEGVTHAEVLEVFGREVTRLRGLLVDVVSALPARGRPDLLVPVGARRPAPPLRPCRECRACVARAHLARPAGAAAPSAARAGLFAGAVACALSVLAPPSAADGVRRRGGPSRCDAGVRLGPADIRTVHRAAGSAAGRLTSVDAAVGRVLPAPAR